MSDFPEVAKEMFWLGEKGMIVYGAQAGEPYGDWLEFGKKLFELKQAIQWAIGDWINYGEANYGEKYAQALDATDISLQTLQNYAWLSKSFDTSRRRENLSWSHHEAVKGIEDISEQDALLDIAESQQMGRDELREVVKKYKGDSISNKGRTIEGTISFNGWNHIFEPDSGERIYPGRARLYLYEGEDNA